MKRRNSFTLIELLVVIAVLAALVALLVPNYMEIRMKARDNKRKSDLRNIQKALELYKEAQVPVTYPAALPAPSCTDNKLVDPINPGIVYMQKVPMEPLFNCSNNYYYKQSLSDTLKYTLSACLENANDAEATACPGDFAAITLMGCGASGTGKCYNLSEP